MRNLTWRAVPVDASTSIHENLHHHHGGLFAAKADAVVIQRDDTRRSRLHYANVNTLLEAHLREAHDHLATAVNGADAPDFTSSQEFERHKGIHGDALTGRCVSWMLVERLILSLSLGAALYPP